MAQAAKPRHGDQITYGYTDFAKNEARNLRLHQLASDPASPVNGQILYRTDTNEVRVYVNGAWQDVAFITDLSSAGIQASIVDAKGDIIAATGADAVSRLAVGANDTVLTADSTTATGLKWAAVPTQYTDEQARDAVGTILTDSTSIDFTYDDAAAAGVGTISAIVIDTSITNAKLANMATGTIKGRSTAGTGVPEDLTAAQVKTLLAVTSTDISDFQTAARSAISVTDSSEIDFSYTTGAVSGSLINGSVALTRLATQAANTFVANNTAGVASPTAITTAQAKTLLAIAPADVTFAAASRIMGRGSAGGAGAGQELTVGGGVEISGTVIQTSAFTGDVTKTSGGTATTIANDAVTNAKLANAPANTIKGNNTGAAADPLDLTPAQVKTLLAIVAADVSDFNTAVRTNRLDQMAAPTASVALNNQKITGLQDGSAASDAATFGQISALMSAQQWKDPVDAATTANITTLAGGAPNAVDGVTLAVGARVLVKNQTTAAENGIYTVTTLGTGANGTWTRSTDADTAAELTDATVLVQEGTVSKGDIYTFPAITTLGTTAATPVQTGEGNTIYTASLGVELVGQDFRLATAAAGDGLSLTGGALAVNAGSGIELSGDAVRIAAAAAGNGLTGGAGSALAVGQGTGISVTADAVAIDTAVVVRKYAVAVTGGTNSEVLTHNLNTRDIAKITLVNTASPYDAIEDFYWEATTVNTVTIYAGAGFNLPAGYRAVVLA